MLFNGIEFLFWFLPLTLILFYVVPIRFRLAVLCAASLYFYSFTGMKPMYGLVLSIVVSWGMCFLFHRAFSRFFLAAAVLFPLSILFFAKYSTFFLVGIPNSLGINISINDIPAMLRIGFPAGISFYTFQLISYNADVYDKRISTEKNPLLFATYIALFPQLIAGPILRFSEIREQLRDLSAGRLAPDFQKGVKFLCVGLFFKIMVADLLYTFCNPITARLKNSFETAGIHVLDGLFYVLGYSFRIYFDFWAYSVMAIGLAAMFGLRLPKNFDEPYLSKNPQVFWRRWHITLSYWLRDYVYIKLGGNKRYIRNIIIVFIACGVWHGAGYGFILWGAYHALLVIAYHYARPWWDRLPNAISIAATFALVTLGWPLFDLGVSGYIQFLSLLSFSAPTIVATWKFAFLALVGMAVFIGRENTWLYNETPAKIIDNPMVHAALFYIALVFLPYGQTFIYFRF